MRLEDCTKEELVCLIRKHCWYDHSCLSSDIQFCRSTIALEKQAEVNAEGSRALNVYIELMKQCEGKTFSEISMDVAKEMEAAFKKWKTCCAKSNRYQKVFDAAMEAVK